MPFLIDIAPGQASTNRVRDRTLNEAISRRFAARAKVHFDTAFEFLARSRRYNVDGAGVGVSSKQRRLRPFDDLNSLYLGDG